MEISGLSKTIRDGTNVKLTCRISRIKPDAVMFWILREQIFNGVIYTFQNDDGNSLTQENKLFYRYMFLTLKISLVSFV